MYIYYYYLCLVTPALRKCHKVSNARRHLTRAIPWMKGYRLPKPDTTSNKFRCVNSYCVLLKPQYAMQHTERRPRVWAVRTPCTHPTSQMADNTKHSVRGEK